MVARGELPPVAELLPLEPRCISPDDEFNTFETGRYSDRWVDVVAGSVEETQGLTGEARAGREDEVGNISPWSFKGWEASADKGFRGRRGEWLHLLGDRKDHYGSINPDIPPFPGATSLKSISAPYMGTWWK